MALISMAVYDTADNNRAALLEQCLSSLAETVDFKRHRIFFSVNSATERGAAAIMNFMQWAGPRSDVFWNSENIGTARAVNKGFQKRESGEVCVKMDDDVVFGRCSNGWLDLMEEAFSRDPHLGILGLKRNDLLESPNSPDPRWRSRLREISHQHGQANIMVEQVEHVMGTCQAFAPELLDKIGYLYQPGLYGFDDSLAATRAKVAGFYSAFLCNVEIHHIDPGGNAYTEDKRDLARDGMAEYHGLKDGYLNGSISIYYGPNGQQDGEPVARALADHYHQKR